MKVQTQQPTASARACWMVAWCWACSAVGAGGARRVRAAAQPRTSTSEQGDARFLREVPIATSRGMITDRNGEPLAVSTPVESIWANPKELLLARQALPALAKALGMPLDELTQLQSGAARDKEFVYLRRHMNPDAARAVMDLDIPGVYAQREFRRFYPHGEVMAHVLGFTNIDDRGQEGLELAFDDWLTGKPGAQQVIRDRRGRIVENVDLISAGRAGPGPGAVHRPPHPVPGLSRTQDRADEHGAAAVRSVVMDVPTGEILAMVNQPSYNPNSRDAHRARDAAQPRGHRRARAGLDDEDVHRGGRAGRAASSRRTSAIETAPGDCRSPGGYMVTRLPQLRHARPCTGC